jgi:hypothetical protein
MIAPVGIPKFAQVGADVAFDCKTCPAVPAARKLVALDPVLYGICPAPPPAILVAVVAVVALVALVAVAAFPVQLPELPEVF